MIRAAHENRMKVYRWIAQYYDEPFWRRSFTRQRRTPTWHRQVECIVAAPSKAQVARLVGVRAPSNLWNLSETWNDQEIATATAQPGVVLVRALSDYHGPWEKGKISELR